MGACFVPEVKEMVFLTQAETLTPGLSGTGEGQRAAEAMVTMATNPHIRNPQTLNKPRAPNPGLTQRVFSVSSN
jgi:hypothetical protein